MFLAAGSASFDLAQKIADQLGEVLGACKTLRFQDGELCVRFEASVRGKDVYIIQSTPPPAENIWELLLMIDAAKRASARSIVAVMPYYGYARQDRQTEPRMAIGARVLADMLTRAGASRVLTMDLHARQIQGFFEIPVDHLEGFTVFVHYLRQLSLTPCVIVSPDSGGAKRARTYARWLNAELAIMEKFRPAPNIVGKMHLMGDVKNKHAIIVDDIIDTGNTLCKAAELLKEKGALSVRAVITHALLSGDAVEKIKNSEIETLIVSDTIPLPKEKLFKKLQIISVAPIFALALKRIHNLGSVSSLSFEPKQF